MTRFGSMTLAATAFFLAVACGEDNSVTPKCDELPLYGYDKIQDPANLKARQAAEAKGCVTMASDGVGSGTGGSAGTDGSAGTAGAAGTGGGAGAGGSAGSAQDAGGD